jgi:two-component system, chemotaxis family, protein-glutamate methylesterase/glutaminase
MQPVESSPQGFTGTISLRLTDLIQMVCLSRSDLIIGVTSRKGNGSIYIKQGQIQHAQTETLTGEEAFFEVLMWNDGQFEIHPFVNNGTETVNKPWEHLLLEAMRSQDEKNPSKEESSADLIQEIDGIFGDLVQSHEDRSGNGRERVLPEEALTPVRVLVVDDSSFFSKKLKEMLEADSTIQVVATAKNGTEALEFLGSGTPVDLVTLDIEMPVMPGDTTLKHVMIRYHSPVLIISSLQPKSMEKIFDFLQLGAVDFFPKPAGRDDLLASAENLRALVRGAARAQTSNFRRLRKGSEPIPLPAQKSDAGKLEILVIVGAEGAYIDWFRLPLRDLCRNRVVIGLQKLPDDFVPEFLTLVEKKTGTRAEHLRTAHRLSPGGFYMGTGKYGAKFKVSKKHLLDLNIAGSETLSWQDGIYLWLNRLAEQVKDSMSVFFLSAVDGLPDALMAKLLGCKIRLILAPPQSVLCSQMVDSIHPYAVHFPDQITFSNPDNLPEVL